MIMPAVAAEPEAENPQRTSRDDLPVVYVAAAYTRPDPVENSHAVIKVADALLDDGIIPVVPHLTLLWHLVSPKPYHRWLDYDRHLLLRCDAVLRVPGFSEGATQECTLAKAHGIPVIRPRSGSPTDCVTAVITWISDRGKALS